MQGVNGTAPRNHTQAIRWLPLVPVVLVSLVLLQGSSARSREAMLRAEQQTLAPIAAMLDLPANATRDQIAARLAVVRQEQEIARRTRVAESLGLGMDWDAIFRRIQRMKKAEQEAARQKLARMFHLPAHLSLPQIKRYVKAPRLPIPAHLKSLKGAFSPLMPRLAFRPRALRVE